MHRDEAALLDIVTAAQRVQDFTRDLDLDGFLTDVGTQSAVLYQIIVIGEATKRLSRDFRQRYPSIPWRHMIGMRNQVTHEYDTVDWEEVWKTAGEDISDLLNALTPLVPTED